jgi:hypothetical protein
MTLLDPGTTVKADYRRDRWGRPLIVPASGGKAKPYTRASSAAKTIEDTFNLELWARRNVVYGMAKDPSLAARVLALGGSPHEWDQDAKKQANAIAEAASTVAQAQRSADIGTAVHRMVERINLGEDVDGGPYQADLDAYRAAVDAMGWVIDPRYVECRMVCDELEMAGTCDLIVGSVVTTDALAIADLKTGSTVEYATLGHAAQLAAYARGDLYDVTDDSRERLNLNANVGFIIHLPAGQGRCDVYALDLARGYEAAELANRVRATRKAAKSWSTPVKNVPNAPESPPEMRGDQEAALEAQARGSTPALGDEGTGAVSELAIPTLGELRAMWADPDEGPDVSAILVEAAKNSYEALGDDKAFVNAIATEAKRNGVPIGLKERPTLRRFEIMRGLIRLAGADCNDEDVRLCVATAMDSDAPLMPAVAVGWAVGAMGVNEAKRFAQVADDHVDGRLMVRDDRLVVVGVA